MAIDNGVFLGYGDIHLEAGTLAGKSAAGGGVRGVWVARETYLIGIDFLSMTGTAKKVDLSSDIGDPSISSIKPLYSQIGLFLGYNPNTERLMHPVYSLTIASGNARWDIFRPTTNKAYSGSRNVTVIDPVAELEFNLLKGVRLGVGVGYRLVIASSHSAINLSSSDISTPHLSISFKAGNFRY